MSAPNAFDEQARRKLAEREHPFDEAAWTAMQPALDAQRDSRRKRRIILWFTFLAGIGTAGWWMARETTTPATVSTHRATNEQQAASALKHEGMTAGRHVGSPAKEARVADRPDGSITAVDEQRSVATPENLAPAPVKPMVTSEPQKGSTANDRGVTTSSSTADPTKPAEMATAPTATTPVNGIGQPSEPIISAVVDPSNAPVVITGRTGEDGHHEETPADPIITTDSTLAEGFAATPVVVRDTTSMAEVDPVASTATEPVPASGSDPIAALGSQSLELSVWGGPFRSTTDYSGALTTDWASVVSSAPSSAFGVELMHQGRYFGYGTGLHYTNYVEHVDSDRLQEESRLIVTDHHLDPVDTTILVVNGVVWLNGQQYYVTQMLDTTIYVLVTTTSEEVSTSVRRNALTRSNSVSYLEIPLLFDAHLRRGNWGFGLRGGPMLGILQGRRGALPNANGYTDLTDEAFSELVLGWSLQGHVRYHLGDHWCVAIGPALRGQLQNTVQTTGLDRRSNAVGGILSIGYCVK